MKGVSYNEIKREKGVGKEMRLASGERNRNELNLRTKAFVPKE